MTTGQKIVRETWAKHWVVDETDAFEKDVAAAIDLALANQRLLTVRAMQEQWRQWITTCQGALGGSGTLVPVYHRDGEMPQVVIDAGLAAGTDEVGPFGPKCKCWKKISNGAWARTDITETLSGVAGTMWEVHPKQLCCQFCCEKRVTT